MPDENSFSQEGTPSPDQLLQQAKELEETLTRLLIEVSELISITKGLSEELDRRQQH